LLLLAEMSQEPDESNQTKQPQPKKLTVPNVIPNPPTTELEKMISGQFYIPSDAELRSAFIACRNSMAKFNNSDHANRPARFELLKELLGSVGSGSYIEPPFYCDYGANIHFGRDVYMNFNCVILDVCAVSIGDGTLFGPNVQIYTATHPVEVAQRRTGAELGKRIEIGKHCWIGGSVVINPGVRIGDGVTIGSGSVVTKDIPSYSVAVGNPAKVVKTLTEDKDKDAAN
jgi:maltose O-acetyltransferase